MFQDWEVSDAFSMVWILGGAGGRIWFMQLLLLLWFSAFAASAVPLSWRSCTCELFHEYLGDIPVKVIGLFLWWEKMLWWAARLVYLLALETYIWSWGQWFVWIQLGGMMTLCYVHTSHKMSWQGNLWNNVYCFKALLLLSIFHLRTDFPNNRCLFSLFICAKNSLSWAAWGGHKCQSQGWSSAGPCRCTSVWSVLTGSLQHRFEAQLTELMWG